ncbi:retinoic acid-induced protein 3 isoform 1-T2 [Menidia menidia]
MAVSSQKHRPLLPLLFLACLPLACLCQTNSSSTISPAANGTTASSNATSPRRVRGCGAGLDPAYRYLCDRRAAWGIVLEALASAGFLLTVSLLCGLLLWTLCACASSRGPPRGGVGGVVLSMSLFLLATAGIFAATFAFIVRLNAETCPTRVFLFSVLFALAFSCLLARCLALLGFAAARGWGEPAVAVGLFAVQVIISAQWLLVVLVRDGRPCEYSQGEFAMLQIYVLCLLALAAVLSLHILCRSCSTYSYSYTGPVRRHWRAQAALLCLTALASVGVWAAWIGMLTRGNLEAGRRPAWDDPALSIALVANGWVLLLGHGLSQVAFFCRGEAAARDLPLSFAGWTSPNADIPGLGSQKEGKENGSFENDGEPRRGRRMDPKLRSPYESGFSMTEIDPEKDYTIPRPQTTNYTEPYDDYYGQD